jgi:hypothetical protein
VPPGPAKPAGIFATRWLHVFEEDTPDAAVYRPETDDLPLSRRPRDGISLSSDGSARILVPGPDDRWVEAAATWHEEGDELVVRADAADGRAQRVLRIAVRSPTRLVVRR